VDPRAVHQEIYRKYFDMEIEGNPSGPSRKHIL